MNLKSLKAAFVNAIDQVFAGAEAVESTRAVTPTDKTITRAAPVQMITSQIYDLLRELNQAAYKIGEDYQVYIDWETYLNLFDVYYDEGELFAIVTRAGKLYRIPIAVSADDVVSLGEMVEIPLTGRATPSSFRVIRVTQPDGTIKFKWAAIACSSVLNRVNEIDSCALFDSFVEYAERTKQYPILSFYHEDEVIRWGQATFLARDGDLYLAWGDWFDTPQARYAAETFEKSTEKWGTSIGYTSTKPPEWLELDHVRIPVFTQGVNPEISIVLEREAAAYHTAFGTTEEVNRMLKTDLAYIRMAKEMGADYADQYLNDVNAGQRAITDADPIRRTNAAMAGSVDAPNASIAEPSTVTALDAILVTVTPPAQTRELVLDENELNALAEMLATKLPFAALQSAMDAQTAAVNAIAPRLDTLEAATRTAQTRTDERLAGLEADDATKRAVWQQDLPAKPQTQVIVRPRIARAEAQEGKETAPNFATISQQTTAQMKSKQGRA